VTSTGPDTLPFRASSPAAEQAMARGLRGTVTANIRGGFDVTASHTYAGVSGAIPYSVTIQGAGGSTLTLTGTATVVAAPAPPTVPSGGAPTAPGLTGTALGRTGTAPAAAPAPTAAPAANTPPAALVRNTGPGTPAPGGVSPPVDGVHVDSFFALGGNPGGAPALPALGGTAPAAADGRAEVASGYPVRTAQPGPNPALDNLGPAWLAEGAVRDFLFARHRSRTADAGPDRDSLPDGRPDPWAG
jgi:hypothetical protein